MNSHTARQTLRNEAQARQVEFDRERGGVAPGPWNFAASQFAKKVLDANGQTVRLTGVALSMSYEDAEAEANARLIAAAPDLLAELKAIVDDMEADCGDPLCRECAVWRPARAAIAKAEGK